MFKEGKWQELVKKLVQELDEREDEADWELEDYSKAHVLQQLALLESAEYLQEGQEVRLKVNSGAKAVVDLAPGVSAGFREVGAHMPSSLRPVLKGEWMKMPWSRSKMRVKWVLGRR